MAVYGQNYGQLPNTYGVPGWGMNPQNTMSSTGNSNGQMNQNQQMFGNLPTQNFGSIMTVFVQGEAGANAYPVASGNTVMLIDFDLKKFWIKSNVNGVPQRLRVFPFYEEIQEQQASEQQTNTQISREEFDKLSKNVSILSSSVSNLIAELGGSDEQ